MQVLVVTRQQPDEACARRLAAPALAGALHGSDARGHVLCDALSSPIQPGPLHLDVLVRQAGEQALGKGDVHAPPLQRAQRAEHGVERGGPSALGEVAGGVGNRTGVFYIALSCSRGWMPIHYRTLCDRQE